MRPIFNVIFKEVTQYLEKNLPEYLTYHSIAHTLYVLDRAIHIANKEKVVGYDLELIKVATLFHDIGFTKTHEEHEKESCKIAKIQLLNYGYSNQDINTICGMIMATEIPQKPKTLLEQILADADLEYLATSNFWTTNKLLFNELKYYNTKLTITDWNQIQVNFIKKHKYHTAYCKHYKKFRKLKNLALLESKFKSN